MGTFIVCGQKRTDETIPPSHLLPPILYPEQVRNPKTSKIQNPHWPKIRECCLMISRFQEKYLYETLLKVPLLNMILETLREFDSFIEYSTQAEAHP